MRFLAAAAVTGLVATGCGGPRDHTATFMSCLQHSGGRVITSTAQLRRYPSADLQQGVGAALDSVAYFSIDTSIGQGDLRQALVFVDDPQATLRHGPMPEPQNLLSRARRGHAGVRALVLMEPAENFDAAIERCEDVAAPGQAYP